ncbi:MAG: hypothetical protein WCW16_05495 [Candidatus Magasanikbacteria bacterium]
MPETLTPKEQLQRLHALVKTTKPELLQSEQRAFQEVDRIARHHPGQSSGSTQWVCQFASRGAAECGQWLRDAITQWAYCGRRSCYGN